GRAYLFKGEADRGQLGRIDLDANGGPPVPANLRLRDTGNLRDLLGKETVEIVIDRSERKRLGTRTKNKNGWIGWIDLPVVRRDCHGLRQGLVRNRDSRLHVLRRPIDALI